MAEQSNNKLPEEADSDVDSCGGSDSSSAYIPTADDSIESIREPQTQRKKGKTTRKESKAARMAEKVLKEIEKRTESEQNWYRKKYGQNKRHIVSKDDISTTDNNKNTITITANTPGVITRKGSEYLIQFAGVSQELDISYKKLSAS